ncbi:acetyl-CoA carboxylase biotin carboxyl carrier protein [Eoetvoesiella caeni]|uniref:Biotin carboxyl carrier protein of acetyl-CoA carboxylase n=1 Tax=Eoetvoesiella caeni TaxID=645616 RepID=A0A366HBI3_9BURK|nr:acetyl-CoA carboxylase biotin carboxyl carrier protein [Eoetvoesiella caeni]MCI2809600.1 acetyl-CoA carboxylase biotin carboxyl carrier protein [Eoetvoesiella caeni]NYT56096.1 acetyl-CoA carboxylase biotin carboxyl carrier protein [Eoetvoesiella caeni]RBP38861.1 biotin carboxyl carrier protein [Eoetvoesiella caeni]
MDIDLAELASLVALLKEAEFTEFRYDKGDVHIMVRRGGVDDIEAPPVTTRAAAPKVDNAARRESPAVSRSASAALSTSAGGSPLEPMPGTITVTAPMLGTFYSAPKPGEPAFVQVGAHIEPDSVLCIIEVMKLMNSVHAELCGEVVAVHARDGELVEFGQPLFSIRETETP